MNARQIFALLAALISLTSCQALNCYQCDSSTDPKCTTDVASLVATNCPTNTATFCYTKSDDTGKVTRGCLEPADATCVAPTCFKSTVESSNIQPICKYCLGTQAECAQSDVSADKFNRVCDLGNYCVSQVNADKTVTRGCGASTTCGTNTDSCTSCNNAALCNKGIFPAARRQCYQCDGAACDAVTATQLLPCLLYVADDQCYSIGQSATTMTRGCYSDAAAKCKATETNAACVACATNSCNNPLYSRPAINCLQCAETEECIAAQVATNAKPCTAITYAQTDACYSQNKDAAAYRGCLNQRDAKLGECTAANGCQTCNTAGCNIAAISTELKCITCRSDNFYPCRTQAEKIGGEVCQNKSPTDRNCFYGQWDGIVLRGCLVDLDPLLQYQCTNKDDKRCTICSTGNDCNNVNYSAAGNLKPLGLAMALLLTLAAAFALH